MRTQSRHILSGMAAMALALGMPAQASAAANANYQGLCTWNATHTQFGCTFDTRRPANDPSSCPGSYIWKYLWDFDDGSTLLTGNPVASHAFPNGQDRLVNLRVICGNGDVADRLRHVCTTVGTPGCLQVNGNWN